MNLIIQSNSHRNVKNNTNILELIPIPYISLAKNRKKIWY